MTEFIDDVKVVDSVFADEFSVFVLDAFRENENDSFVVFVEFVKILEELIHIERNFRKIDESGTFAADFGKSGGACKPSCVASHNLDYNNGVAVINVNVLDNFRNGKGDIFCGRTETGAMVRSYKVIVDGFRNADDAAFIILGRHIFGNLVAGIHAIVAAVIEEIADIVFFEDFEDAFIVCVVLPEILEFVTAASDKGSGGCEHEFKGFGILFSHIDDIVVKNTADSVLCRKDLCDAFFAQCGFNDAVCAGVDYGSRTAGLTDKSCADEFAHKNFPLFYVWYFVNFHKAFCFRKRNLCILITLFYHIFWQSSI